jgi:predicted RNA-binding protein YlqC (UPF0109 family)
VKKILFIGEVGTNLQAIRLLVLARGLEQRRRV